MTPTERAARAAQLTISEVADLAEAAETNAQSKADAYRIGYADGADLGSKAALSAVHFEALLEAARDLLSVLDVDGPSTDDEPDDAAIGWQDKTPVRMTFGHVRRLRKVLSQIDAEAEDA